MDIRVTQISTGLGFSLFLDTNDTVWGCGYTRYGQLCHRSLDDIKGMAFPVRIPLAKISMISAGQYHSMYLDFDGHVHGCGDNIFATLGVPSGEIGNAWEPIDVPINATIALISASEQHTAMLDTQGHIWVAGGNLWGKLGTNKTDHTTTLYSIRLENLPRFKSLEARTHHTVALTESGDVYFFGTNVWGQFCTGTFGIEDVNPVAFKHASLFDIKQIHTSATHSIFVNDKNQILTCGHNNVGALGMGDFTSRYTTVINPYLTLQEKITKVVVGDKHTFVIAIQDGYHVLYGYGSAHHLSFSTLAPRIVPNIQFGRFRSLNVAGIEETDISVFSLEKNSNETDVYQYGGATEASTTLLKFDPNVTDKKIVQIAIGEAHIIFLSQTGQVYSQGMGGRGQMGIPTITNLDNITAIPINFTAKSISAGNAHSMILSTNGSLYNFGHNGFYQLGFIDRTNRWSPTWVNFTDEVIGSILGGTGNSYILTSKKNVYAAGRSDYGQLCSSGSSAPQILFQKLALSDVIQVSPGGLRTMFLTSQGLLYGCGANSFGQLGLGQELMFHTPTLVNFTGVVAISSGYQHTLILTNESIAYGTGRNEDGGLGLGTHEIVHYSFQKINVLNVTGVYAGHMHSFITNSCPDGCSGLQCEDFVCFDIPSSLPTVCGASGSCTGPNKCECESPSSGPSCQFKEYTYIAQTPSSFWNDPTNWAFKRSFGHVVSYSIPSLLGDKVSLKMPGRFNITIEPCNIGIGSLSIGAPGSVITLIIKGSEIKLNEFVIHANSFLEVYDSIITIPNQFKAIGTINLYRSTIITPESIITARRFNTWDCKLLIPRIDVAGPTGSLTTLTNTIVSGTILRLEKGTRLTIIGNSRIESEITNRGRMVFNAQQGTIYIAKITNLAENDNLAGQINFQGRISSISSTKRSLIDNRGYFSLVGGHTSFDVQNTGNLTFAGMHVTNTFTGRFQAMPDSNLNLINSTLIIDRPFIISNGVFRATGTIKCPHLMYDSTNGEINLSMYLPNRLFVDGNFTIGRNSTAIIRAFDSDLTVSGKFAVNGLLFLRCREDKLPKPEDRLFFARFNTTDIENHAIHLFGAPHMNAKLVQEENTFYFDIMTSFGSVDQTGYVCHYLGNGRIIETNNFDVQNKMIISFTTASRRDRFLAFAFNTAGGNYTQSYGLTTNVFGDVTQVQNHNVPTSKIFSLGASLVSRSLFEIGQNYTTLSIVIPSVYLHNQTHVYFAELFLSIPNGTLWNAIGENGHPIHYFESWPHQIFKDNPTNCTNFMQPLRAEIYRIEVYSIMIGLYIIVLIACIVFYRYRPMITRGISPIMTTLFLLIQLAAEAKNLRELPSYQGSLCIYYSFMFPLHEMCFMMIFLYFVRYFSIINFNEYKADIYHKESKGSDLEWQKRKLKFFKFLATSPFLTFGLLFLTFFLSIGLNFIIMGAYKFHCQFNTLILIKIVANVHLLVLYIAILACLFLDYGYRICKMSFYKYLFEDAYAFRLQVFLFVPFMFYSIISDTFQIAISGKYIWILKYHWATIILNTIGFFWLLVIDVLFPLSLTIYWLIRPLCKKVKRKEIEQILNNEVTKQLFTKFCENEYSVENISAYYDIVDYKKNPNIPDAILIYEKYFCGSKSIMEVNCQRKTCNEIYDQIQTGSMGASLFDKVMLDIMMNLADTYSRFVFSENYERYVQHDLLQKEMIEGKFSTKTLAIPLLDSREVGNIN